MSDQQPMTRLDRLRALGSSMARQRRKPDPAHAIPANDRDLSSKTIVFTGGTDGMGRVAVDLLQGMGATLVLLGRDETKGEAIAADLGTGVEFVRCDLSSLASVRSAAEQVLADHPRIDVLVNGAGLNAPERHVTEDGFELHWAVNYLGPYLLTNLLLERLKVSSPSRIVNVSSAMEAFGHIRFNDLQLEKGFSTGKAYSQAKLALNMFTLSLSRQLEGSGVTDNALNPGFVNTNLLRDVKGTQSVARVMMRLLASPPIVGADRIVRLAVSSEYDGVSGQFVFEDDPRPPNPEALDPEIVAKLMEVSREAAGLDP